MDLQLYARVLWRFKLLVVSGVLLGACLALLSVVKVSSDGLEYREDALYFSTTRMGVTQNGFPWGRLFAESSEPEQARNVDIPIANPARFNELAVLYAELATSDAVRRRIRLDPRSDEAILAAPLRDAESGTMLPLIELTSIATSPKAAILLARRSSVALRAYLEERQQADDVPASDRVVLEEVQQARKAGIYQPRSKTMPIVILLATMFATIGLAFLLENLRPRHRDPAAQNADLPNPAQRRSA